MPVTVIYHVRPGAEEQLEALLVRTWETYRKERMVCSEPHIRVRTHEDQQHDRFIEIFTWSGCFATEYPPVSVETLWKQIGALCETRDGDHVIEFRDTKMFAPRIPEPNAD